MRCTVCGAKLEVTSADLPFNASDSGTVLVKGLPVLQCSRCPHRLIADEALARVDEILDRLGSGTVREVAPYPA